MSQVPHQVGPYTLQSIETGTFALDGGAMFGIVPKTIWEKSIPADDQNRIGMNLRALLVRGPGMNLLVDCGMGSKWSEKHQKIYKIDHHTYTLERSLQQAGLTPEDITHVVLTHLHFDHAGGMTYADPHSPKDFLPTFPRAKVYLQQRNWDLGWHPNEKDRASYLTENYSIYADGAHSARNLERIETRAVEPTGKQVYDGPRSDEETLLPGISVEVSNGHTLGMQIVRISDPHNPANNVVYCADLIPTSAHVRVPFIMGYDCYPIFILAEKKKLLNRAADEGSILFYEHCPLMAASRVVRTPKGDFEAGERILL